MGKYQSEIINEILEKRGHVLSSLHYESECIDSWIEEVKGGYPKLCDYQSEWLNYVNENPIGEFPYETITDVTEATINNVVPYAYESAILKGNTGYRDIDTGEILETLEEGRNLELASVKMPVLTTTNGSANILTHSQLNDKTGEIEPHNNSNKAIEDYILIPNNPVIVSNVSWLKISFYDANKIYISNTGGANINKFELNDTTIPTNAKYFRLHYNAVTLPLIRFVNGTDYIKATIGGEPFKTNILSCLEPVELGSVGEVKDELNLLTQQLTQRTETRPYQEGDELNSEFVTDMTNTRYKLAQEVVKTVDLSVVNQDGETLSKLKPIEGTMHISTDGNPIKPTFSGKIPVEAITQNLTSFIEE